MGGGCCVGAKTCRRDILYDFYDAHQSRSEKTLVPMESKFHSSQVTIFWYILVLLTKKNVRSKKILPSVAFPYGASS